MRQQRFIIVILILGVTFVALSLLLVIAFSVFRPRTGAVDAVIVLGAKVGTPALKARALEGLNGYQQGQAHVLVLSGGQGDGENISEAEAMRRVIESEVSAKKLSMPNIVTETKSLNTLQNLRNSKELLPDASTVIVTSDNFHLARAFLIAKGAGFKHVIWDAPAPSYYHPWDLAYYFLREAVGVLADLPHERI